MARHLGSTCVLRSKSNLPLVLLLYGEADREEPEQLQQLNVHVSNAGIGRTTYRLKKPHIHRVLSGTVQCLPLLGVDMLRVLA